MGHGTVSAHSLSYLVMSGEGVCISLALVILAFVFPAIVAAAIALACYGYRDADVGGEASNASAWRATSSWRSLLRAQVEDRIDTADARCRGPPSRPTPRPIGRPTSTCRRGRRLWRCSTRGPKIERCGLDAGRRGPPARERLPADLGEEAGVEGAAALDVTSSEIFRHRTELFEGKLVLIGYAEKTERRLTTRVVASSTSISSAPAGSKTRLGAGQLARDAAPSSTRWRVPGLRRAEPRMLFSTRRRFGKTLYAWRLCPTPRRAEPRAMRRWSASLEEPLLLISRRPSRSASASSLWR